MFLLCVPVWVFVMWSANTSLSLHFYKWNFNFPLRWTIDILYTHRLIRVHFYDLLTTNKCVIKLFNPDSIEEVTMVADYFMAVEDNIKMCGCFQMGINISYFIQQSIPTLFKPNQINLYVYWKIIYQTRMFHNKCAYVHNNSSGNTSIIPQWCEPPQQAALSLCCASGSSHHIFSVKPVYLFFCACFSPVLI